MPINHRTIVDTWQDRWSIYLSKQEYIATCIAWAISHELHHADQLISMVMYGSNEAYKNEMEADVERASYDWICNHSRELSELIGIRMCMDKLESNTLVDKGNYKKANVREFYLQTIANIVIRDLNLFDQLKVFNNDNMCDDMILVFNDIDTIVIKSNGKFLEENIVPFCNLVYKYCSVYNMYHISVDASFSYNSTGRCMVTVQFNVSKPLIHPMKFKSDSPISV